MFLMYVDESGDTGLINSPTRYFVLSGIVLHELRWHNCLDVLINFRRSLRAAYGLKLREEFHAASFINNPGITSRPQQIIRIKRFDRLKMIRQYADCIATMPDLNIINVLVDKQGKTTGYDVFENAWKALIQRFENTIKYKHFVGPSNKNDMGIIFCDQTINAKLTKLVRRMRLFNPIPHQPQFGAGYRHLPLQYITEDPIFRVSKHSLLIQSADLSAFLLYQRVAPSAYMRRKAGTNYFRRLDPVLCKVASSADRDGIVRL